MVGVTRYALGLFSIQCTGSWGCCQVSGVQGVQQDALDAATQRQWAERAVRAVNRASPFVEYTTWPQ
jgi:hypothetical protein